MYGKVSIILLNYNGKQFNKACIDSLLQQSYKNFEIIFVNNQSDDGSCEEVEKLFITEIAVRAIKMIDPWYNSGFAGGNNIWAAASDPDSEYICLLNNDTILPTHWLENMVGGIRSDPSLWAVWGMIYDQGYEEVIKNLMFVQYKKWVNNYFFDSVIVDQTEEDKAGPVIYTTGVSWCCVMWKKSLLKQPFDEIYFAYLEDTALCMKILLQGYRIGLAKEAIVYHFWSGSFGRKPSLFKVFHGQKNYILNFILLSQWWYWIIIFPFFMLWILIRTLFSNPLIRIYGLIKALQRVISNTKQIQHIKKSIKRTISIREFYKQLSPQFMSIPFYAKSNKVYTLITAVLNKISVWYFSLSWIFLPWLGK